MKGLVRQWCGLSSLAQLCDEDDLYCKPCNQYFNNLHNKREHIFGRKHLQTMSAKFHEEEKDDELPVFNIPIFTEQFMDFNRGLFAREALSSDEN